MRQSAAQSTRLRSAVERSGYYPALVLDSLQTALGNRSNSRLQIDVLPVPDGPLMTTRFP